MKQAPSDKATHRTISGRPIKALYGPADLPGLDKIGTPGEYPFTRGIRPDMYRGKLWTMRQFSGFGTAQETNQRLKFLMQQGQSGLSIAFDLPTLMGIDSDDPLAAGEVGKCGVAIDSLADMEALFDGIRLDRVTTSMTINAPAAILLAMYIAVAEKQGADLSQVSGTVQNDILKEYIAQKEWIFPPEPSMRLIVDSIEFCTRHLPRYNTISVSGYHIREAGSTALQELAFTLRDGIEYVEWCRARGMEVDSFAPRLSFFFNAHNDFFEEVAKFRAARRVWAETMRERFGARDPRSWMCRFHAQTAGCSLTSQQPVNNVVRTTIQALAAVLGGTNSLHTNSLDEALALPTEEAVTTALRTQQIIAFESGVAETVDPLGGSFLVESLTDDMASETYHYIARIDELGGMVSAIEKGFPQREIEEAAFEHQQRVEREETIVVGVNRFAVEEERPTTTLRIPEETRNEQVSRLQTLKAERNNRSLTRALKELESAARTDQNLMPPLLACVRDYGTVGEICNVLKNVFGIYEEPVF